MDKQLAFFTKDSILWGDYAYAGFYKTLYDLKHRNEALWNGEAGGPLVKISTGHDEEIYAFTREKNGAKVLVVINLSAGPVDFTLGGDQVAGAYQDMFSGESVELSAGAAMSLGAWEYRVFEQQ